MKKYYINVKILYINLIIHRKVIIAPLPYVGDNIFVGGAQTHI